MGGTSEKSLKKQKMEKFMEYTKKILCCFNNRRSTDQTAVVLCDELFKPAKKRHVDGDDPVLSAYIAAQNYFTVRPNIYL